MFHILGQYTIYTNVRQCKVRKDTHELKCSLVILTFLLYSICKQTIIKQYWHISENRGKNCEEKNIRRNTIDIQIFLIFSKIWGPKFLKLIHTSIVLILYFDLHLITFSKNWTSTIVFIRCQKCKNK